MWFHPFLSKIYVVPWFEINVICATLKYMKPQYYIHTYVIS
jgi:hypothetical protein